jgi:hypothetical protein
MAGELDFDAFKLILTSKLGMGGEVESDWTRVELGSRSEDAETAGGDKRAGGRGAGVEEATLELWRREFRQGGCFGEASLLDEKVSGGAGCVDWMLAGCSWSFQGRWGALLRARLGALPTTDTTTARRWFRPQPVLGLRRGFGNFTS